MLRNKDSVHAIWLEISSSYSALEKFLIQMSNLSPAFNNNTYM